MSDEKRKLEPPLYLDMPFDEALGRFAHTKPADVEPPKGKKPKIAKIAGGLAGLPKEKSSRNKPAREPNKQ